MSKIKSLIASKLMDLGNLGIAALTFGQLVSEKPFSVLTSITGIVLLIWLYAIAYALQKDIL